MIRLRTALRIVAVAILGLSVAIVARAQGDLSSQVLRLLSRVNTWTATQTFASSVGVTLQPSGLPPTLTNNTLYNLGGNLYFNGVLVATSAGAGTVTSVGLTMPAVFSVANSPVTSSGTLAVTLATESANRVWAGPTTGAAASPTFRALVAADIPDLSATYLMPAGAQAVSNKTGNISQWTNDAGYITSAGSGSTSIITLGTVTTGTWNATVITGQYGGTGVANTGKTITLGGNFSTSGAFAGTLTLTAATNVTLPTSGTLVNTAVATLSSLTSIGTIGTGTWQGTVLAALYGGTGQSSYTIGDLLFASGSTALSKLADVATGSVLISGGVGVAPAYGKVDLTAMISNALGCANGGTGATSAPTNGQLPIGNGTCFTLNTLTGTASQIIVTNSAGGITLALPQNIATSSTPQWARLGLGTAAGATAVLTTTGEFDTGYFDSGSSGATKSIDFTNGMLQLSTLSANTVYTFLNPIAGTTYTLLVKQDGTGSRTVTWPGTVTWQGGSAPTLTTTAGKQDICTFTWNGAAYLARCSLNY